MHIPKGTTAQLELVSFDDAIAAADSPNQEYDVEKWKTYLLSVPQLYL